MLKNYFTTAFRHLLKNKGTTVINVTGLALGIACLLIILVMVRYELSFDQFHSHADRIYRVVRTAVDDSEYRTGVSYPLTEAIRREMTAIEQVTATQFAGSVQVGVYDNQESAVINRFEEWGFALIEPSFFDIFDFKGTGFRWIAGNPATALTEPFTLILTQPLAEKYFPGENPLGKTLRIDNRVDFKVTGVVAELPANTDFPFRIIGSYASMKAYVGEGMNDWISVDDDNQVYVLLQEGITEQEAEAQIAQIHAGHVPEQLAATRLYPLQPLQEMHADPRFGNYKGRTVSTTIIRASLLIGFFLLLTGCINFVNLATAQATVRSKEVGIRKVMGSKRRQLIVQFLGETLILTSIASLLAIGAAELVILYGKDLLQVQPHTFLFGDPFVLLSLGLIVLVVTLLAGLYPALVQSGFQPIAALKNKVMGRPKQSIRLRSGLVVFQFVVSQVFIIGTLVIIQQMDYFKSADLGFDQQAIVAVSIPERQQDLQALANQWKTMSTVEQVSFSSTLPSGTGRATSHRGIRRRSASLEEEGLIFELQLVDEHYLDLYQIGLAAGRNFLPSDTAHSIIINETLSRHAGFEEPSQAIGEEMPSGEDTFRVIGVMQDFHSGSLKGAIDNVAFVSSPKGYATASIKLAIVPGQPGASQDLQATIAAIEKAWTATFPEYVFDYAFLDDNIAMYYQEETRLSQLFKILAGITIFIGCLGLYGLVAFMAVRRNKEVGIRKVLGASITQILVLFSKEFTVLILVAFCIAAPLAFYLMRQWLNNFTYKIEIGIGVFLVAITASLLIALLTVSYQSIKAALANPIDSLKNE